MTAEREGVAERWVAVLEAMRDELRRDIATKPRITALLNGRIAALDAAIRALRQGGGWIPVSERLPEFTNWDKSGSAEVAVLTEDGKVLAAYWKSNAYAKTERGRAPRWERNHAILGANVIAWQPLPAPPSPAKEG